MNATDALDLSQLALWTVISLSAPAVVPAMFAGLAIALFQALTQIQEVTLTFVPKILVALFSLVLFSGFIGASLVAFSEQVYDKVEHGFL
ncbi:flagellar biosynthesis protein FliQ [Notoacmeibacter sp. MSK16QG-6]|uniref:flagellar biosynthesis protein FliQ n=1 Tax=Notoacmeibacter sp. MSK16QG-6 TaxID=2957982 RepID=UPI00209F3407|nr:flagellar biosynthesis protein FliQ [Notoacmeibacter sp. MSK16QG-6]MCP1200941.1 flagellar biosynthesis protein FliQ [Notoacmeibacter sp. MSK16QG-6]